MPTTQKERKSDVRQLVGILDEFAEEDVRRAVTELGLAGNGAAGLDPGRISLDLPAAVAVLDFLPLLFLAVGETVTWAITGEIGGNWQVEVKGVSSSRGGQPYTVGQPGRDPVVKGFLTVADGTFGATLQVPKGATLRLRIGADTVSTFQTP